MAKVNVKKSATAPKTHEGGRAQIINPEQMLRRSVMSCLLWEDQFYEDGKSIASRIQELVPLVDAGIVSALAVEARSAMNLRHVPLLLAREMLRHKTHRGIVGGLLPLIIQRADELSEFVAMLWDKKKVPTLTNQGRKGLAEAFRKFNAYQLAKYDKKDAKIKLRDVLFLCHAKPKDEEQAALWKQLIAGTLPIPDTWEVALSTGKDKKETWIRLINEKNLGALALLRNLRNMKEVGVPDDIVAKAIVEANVSRVIPFRFIAAARHAMQHEPALETAMFKSLEGKPKLSGETVILIDVSGSMDDQLSGKSDMTRIDAGCGVAMCARQLSDNVSVYTFSNVLVQVPPRLGFALRDAIVGSQPHSGTNLGGAVKGINAKHPNARLIVITDEQSHDPVPDYAGKGYVINVASYKHGVGYGKWTHLDGFSENVLTFIREIEQ